MGNVSASSTVLIDADPATVLDAVADYQGVRPKILSPQYSEYRVLQGGHGRGTVASWTKFYDDSFPDSPSVPNSSWQAEVGTWRRRFEVANKETVDVVIHQDGADTLHSLVISSPARVSDR